MFVCFFLSFEDFVHFLGEGGLCPGVGVEVVLHPFLKCPTISTGPSVGSGGRAGLG